MKKKTPTHAKGVSLTLLAAQAQVKKINPNWTLKKVYDEYQVYFGVGRGIYYTDDLQDAVDTATCQAKLNVEAGNEEVSS